VIFSHHSGHRGKFFDFFPVAKQIFTTEHFVYADKMPYHFVHMHGMVLTKKAALMDGLKINWESN
jgi:hypothetical protein